MVKERRCNLFDDNGRPRRLRDGTKGCFRHDSVCHFAHPHEHDWETAHPSLPPRHDAVVDSDSEFFYILASSDRRDRDWEKWERDRGREWKTNPSFHSDSPPHRKDSTTTRGPPSRRSTLDSGVDGVGTTKRARSPALSVSPDQLETLKGDDKYRTKDDLSLTRQDHAPSSSRRSHSKDKGKEREQADSRSHTPLVKSRPVTPTDQHLPTLPPEPREPPQMQPPPPPPQLPAIPDLPSFVSNQHPTSSASGPLKELSMDEQRTAWHERIDLMFTSIASRRDYAKLESDLAQIQSLSGSSHMHNIPEAVRANVDVRKTALELQMDRKRKEINEIIQKLVGSAFWPILRTPQVSELEKTLGDTKKHVLEMRSLLDDVKNSCAALLKTNVPDWTQDSERPSKRRKMEGKVDTPVQSVSGDADDKTEDTERELELFRDKLTKLEHHLIDLDNDIIQRDKIVSDEIELHIEARLEEEDALYPPISDPLEATQAEIEAVVDMKNRELARAVAVTGEEIGALAVEVAELITKVNNLEARCKALEAENHEFKSKLTQNVLSHAKSQDALVRRDKEIEAIAAALQAYISQAPAGQTAGDLPSAEYIIEALDSQLDGLFREKFCTTLISIQQDVFDKVEESHKRTINTISPKIKLLLGMVNLITTRLGKSDAEAAHPG